MDRVQRDVLSLIKSAPVERRWLVPGILPTHSIIVLAGDAGVGKSSLCYRLGMSMATGTHFLNRAVQPTRVIYFDEENNEPDCQAYMSKLWKGEPGNEELLRINFRFEHFSLIDPKNDCYHVMARMVSDFKPMLIVIDTYVSALEIEDPNSNGEANVALHKLRLIKSLTDEACTMVLLHHITEHPKTHEKDIAGAKGLKRWTDGTILHKLAPGRPRTDGLHRSVLEFAKLRGFGSHRSITITPVPNSHGGVRLVGSDPDGSIYEFNSTNNI